MSEIDHFEISFNGQISPLTETWARFDNLTPDTQYTFMVRAVRGGVYGGWTSLTVYTVENTLGVPENLIATGRTANSISLSWDAVDGAAEYLITFNAQTILTNTNSITLGNLTSNTEYIITVQARNENSISGKSDALIVRTLQAPFAAVTGLRYTNRTNSSITLAWDSLSGIDSYEVMFGEEIISLLGSEITISGLEPGTQHTFAVRAYSAENIGEWSDVLTVTTLRGPAALHDAITVRVQNVGNFEIVIAGDNLDIRNNTIFTVSYDTNMLQLVDFASHTGTNRVTPGRIPNTDIEIISVSPGLVEFRRTRQIPANQVWSGILTIVEFRALSTGSTTIMFGK